MDGYLRGSHRSKYFYRGCDSAVIIEYMFDIILWIDGSVERFQKESDTEAALIKQLRDYDYKFSHEEGAKPL